jgi:hypothetical protein
MDAEPQNFPPGEQKRKGVSGDQVVGRQRPARQEHCPDICGGCVQCLVSSV